MHRGVHPHMCRRKRLRWLCALAGGLLLALRVDNLLVSHLGRRQVRGYHGLLRAMHRLIIFRSLRSVRRLSRVAAPLGLLLVASMCAWAQCASCEDAWASAPCFERSNTRNYPTTLGLPVGEAAPGIDGVAFEGRRTLVAVFPGFAVDSVGILGWLAEIPELQIVAAFSGFTATELASFEPYLEGVVQVHDPLAAVVAAEYQAGSHHRVVFFVDERGFIVYRRYGGIDWLARSDRAAAREFASTGCAPGSAIPQELVWFGSHAAVPTFLLETLDGEHVAFPAGKPRVIFWGRSLHQPADLAIQSDLDLLRDEYPQVDFLWIVHATSDMALESMWISAAETGLLDRRPSWFTLEKADYMKAVTTGRAADMESLLDSLGGGEFATWQCLLDWDGKLGTLWTLPEYPALMILDEDNVVHLPMTTYPVNLAGDGAQTHPGALTELRRILDAIVDPE